MARSRAKSSATPRAVRAAASIKWTRTMTGKFPATNGRAIRNDSTASTPMATGRSRKKRYAAPVRTDLKDRGTEGRRDRETERQREGGTERRFEEKNGDDLSVSPSLRPSVPPSLSLSVFLFPAATA